ncbi:unnamed protein product [Phytophthora lilii]|uniref:Unnamed protein product n=1 Tax=Phytophthora lilii TaxID=2077276 RepID=A0A9W7CGQ0_9STRA|nr:unnamed protein product [Phytophthora lilii]
MLSSFELVDGNADAVQQEHVFNQHVQDTVRDTFARTRNPGDSERNAELIEFMEDRSECAIDYDFQEAEVSCSEEQIAKFKELPTEEEGRKKQHRAKNRLGLKQRSKPRHHLKLRKPGRDSQSVKHSKPGVSTFLKGFMQQEQVKAALMSLRKARAAAADAFREEDNIGQLILPDVAIECSKTGTIEPKTPAEWPRGVQRCDKQLNLSA